MKQKIFTLMILLALVVVGGKAFGQGTARLPYIGTEESYSWANVTAASYYYTVTTTSAGPTDSPATPGTHYSVTGGSLTPTGTLANASSAAVELTWLAGSNTGTYYVWLVATSADGCPNFRFIEVDPSNQVDFILSSLGLQPNEITYAALGGLSTLANDATECPIPDDMYQEDLQDNGAGTTSNGTVFAYFRVAQGANNTGDGWQFEFNTTGSIGTITYNIGSGWVANPAAGTPIAVGNGITAFVRVQINTPIATDATAVTLTGNITNNQETTTLLADVDDTNDHISLVVNRIAAIGDFVD